MANGFTTFNLGTLDTLTDVALQADGKIVVVGHTRAFGNDDWVVARFSADGTLDASFGNGGIVVTALSTGGDTATSVAIQPDGKIVVGGEAGDSGAFFTLVRYNANGSLDTSFSGDGIAVRAGGTTSGGVINDIALQADGKIVATGNWGGANNNMGLLRFNADGSTDTTFGTTFGIGSGVTVFGPGQGQSTANGVLVEPNGNIIAVGYASDTSSQNSSAIGFAVARFSSAGVAIGGPITQIGIGSDQAAKVLRQPDGKIVVVGYGSDATSNASTQDFAVVRYNADLTIDTTFGGGDGIVRTDVDGGNSSSPATSVAMQSDGKLVLAGRSNGDFAVVRYNTDGSLDTSFGGTGMVVVALGTAADEIEGVAIQPDGKIVVVGISHQILDGVGLQQDFAIARFNPNGTLDTTFAVEKMGTSGPDALTADPTGSVINGLGGADTLTGSNVADTLNGGDGDDFLTGGGGNDRINGGDGNADFASYANAPAGVIMNLFLQGQPVNTVGAGIDTLTGIEHLQGSAFNDVLLGNAGVNALLGGAGDDVLDGGPGNDTMNGGDGFDIAAYVFATAGVTVDLNRSGAAQNTIGAGADQLDLIEGVAGSSFNDVLSGTAGVNALFGGAGFDIINGRGGFDLLGGGSEADYFVFSVLTDSIIQAPDIIVDFEAGIDKLDFRGMNLAAADRVSITTGVGIYTMVDIDAGNNGTIDFRVVLAGNPAVTRGDMLGVPAGAPAAEAYGDDAGHMFESSYLF